MSFTLVREAEVICRSRDGREVARVHVFAGNDDSPLLQLDPQESRRLGEAEVQLRENGRYEYQLGQCPPDWRVQCNLAQRSARARYQDFGLIEPGAYCGLLRIEVVTADSALAGAGCVEVRSVKLDYREQYRTMLSDLSRRMMNLLYDARSSSQMTLSSAWRDEPRFLQQQIEFLRETLDSPAFRGAIQRVIDFPHHRLQSEPIVQPIQKPLKHNRGLIRQITGGSASGNPRIPSPGQHSLTARMQAQGIAQPSLPAMVIVSRKTDNHDTVENQFIKFALTSFRDFLSHAVQAVRQCGPSWDVVAERAQRAERELGQVLSQGFFQDISPLRIAPFGSPVLQRRAGYREIFQTWLRFEANAKLEWDASDDLFHAGKRDVAKLYEYWLFFHLLDWFCARFDGARLDARKLVEPMDGGRVMLKLKHGVQAGPFEGVFASNQRRLRAQLRYNCAFVASANRGETGSWTRKMQPDYTLTFWPAEYDLQEAEAQELAVHIHFDAKYRVENLRELFGAQDEDEAPADAEPEGERGNFKRADLLKMHAYRDAVRRSEGAYIFYPGSEADRAMQWRPGQPHKISSNVMLGFHEILPGLGAFAITPGLDGKAQGFKQLEEFLDAVLEHLCNRATQREQRAYHVYDTARLAGQTPPEIRRALHEKDGAGNRAAPPYEQLIIVAWYAPEAIDWMLTNNRVVLRLGDPRGGLPLVRQLSAASHILLRSRDNETQPGLFRISEEAGLVLTRADLAAQNPLHLSGDPGEPNDIFAVFRVEADPAYQDWRWDGEKLCDAIEAFERRRKPLFTGIGRTSPLPRILSLGDLVSAAVSG